VLQSVRLPRSSGVPRGLPLGSCRVEARVAACVERDHLGWTRHRFGACRDPYEMKVHLGSSLSCRASEISGAAVSKPTTSSGSATALHVGVTGRTRTGTAGITTPDACRYTTVT
jgi:hypothetical protein